MLSLAARTTRACGALAIALAASPLASQSAAEAAKLEFFEQRIRPVLASSCYCLLYTSDAADE